MNAISKVSPQVAEAMSVSDLLAECRALASQMGPKAEVRVGVMARYGGNDAMVHIYPDGMARSLGETAEGKSWPEAFAAAQVWISTHKQVRRNNIIRKMALAVISITDEFGECPEARLRAADFSRDEISEFHQVACARASEMCASAPFSVLMETV